MPDSNAVSTVKATMLEFAEQTGLSPSGANPPARYLWTDAFAVCNFLGLHQATGDPELKRLAVQLIDQVHYVLGRHREDDERKGWLSGLGPLEGERHPTRGGLRIGKKLKERGPDAPFDERLEWNRDGQYFHYLTKWMHALDRTSRALHEAKYGRWATELAKTAHARFSYATSFGREKRLYWKMSIDLSYPLVASMGHHDPLDGFVTYVQLDSNPTRDADNIEWPDLETEIAEIAKICSGKNWATDDSLGIGGLLSDAYRLAQLIVQGAFSGLSLLEAILESALQGLKFYTRSNPMKPPAEVRLAFRELGLSIGLHALEQLSQLAEEKRGVLLKTRQIQGLLNRLLKYTSLGSEIEAFWQNPAHQAAGTWKDHLNINRVMLATSLLPEGFLHL